MNIGGEIAKAKVPKKVEKSAAPLYSPTAVADEHFADFLVDKSNATALEKKMMKVI